MSEILGYRVYPLTAETDGTCWTILVDGIEGAVTETENEEEIEAQALSVFVDFRRVAPSVRDSDPRRTEARL